MKLVSEMGLELKPELRKSPAIYFMSLYIQYIQMRCH